MIHRLPTAAFLAVLFLAASGLRFGFTLAYRGDLTRPFEGLAAGADPFDYDLFGRNMAAGRGYVWEDGTPTSFRAPGLPLFLAGLYSVVGVSYPAAYAALALLGGACAVATFFLARELADERFARWAAVLAAVYPPDVYACSHFFSEALFAPLLGGGLALLARGVRTHAVWPLAAGGLLLGLAALTRSFAVLLLPLFAVWLLGHPLARRGWVAAAVFSVGFLAAVLPWTARNYHVHGRPVLIATNGGSTFYGANNPVVAASLKEHGNWIATTKLPGRDLIDAQPDEVSHDKMEWKLGADWVKEHPGQFAKLGVFKVIRFWLPFVNYPSLKVYPVANVLLTTPFLVVILVGLFASVVNGADRRRFAVLHLTMLANLVMVVIFWGDPRFRDANTPVLMCYAVVGLLRLSGWFSRRRGAVPAVAH